MSIVVAVRVRPVYDSATAQGGRRTAQRRDANDSTNLLDDPSVCGALRFVRDTHITFTQDAMEALEAERLEAASAAAGHQSVGPSAALRSGQFPSSRRSQTPPASQRTSQELLPPHPRGHSPVLSRASSAARRSGGASPLRSSSHATLATQHRAPSASHPLPQPSTKTRFARPVFEFDCCFSSEKDHLVYGTQHDVYDRLGAPLLQRFLQGYNCCLMAYGQTGSGKTYSMFGPHADELADVQRQRAITSTSPLPPRHVPGVSAKSSLVRRLQYDEDRGIIFRLLEECFTEMKQHKDVERRASLSALRSPAHAQDAAAAMVNFDVEITYYQVYREKVYCLLTGSHQSSFAFDANCQSGSAVKSLRVRESAKNGPYVEGLKSTNVRTLEDAVALLDLGNKNRRVAATSQNIHSSRSHAVLSLRLRCIRSSEDASFTSVMNLVDLAGSERAGKLSEPSLAYASTFSMPRGTGNAARLSETSDINRSLSTLGKVIHVLAAKANGGSNVSPPMSAVSTARGTSARSHQQQASINISAMSQQQQQHVPYRESTLTFLLRDSLGGNSSTTILSTISPMLDDVAETLSTLRYASKARHIINTPVVNTDAKSAMLVSALRDEVQHLRQQLQVSLSATHQRELEETMTAKQRQLDEYESEMANMSQERSQWEVEKVTMMERVVVLEHEAESLRDELTAAMETADEYRAKLEQLTLMVEGDGGDNSGRVLRQQQQFAAQARNVSATDDHFTVTPRGGVMSGGTAATLPGTGSATSSRRGSSVFAQTIPPPTTSSSAVASPSSSAAAAAGVTSRAIVFGSSSRSASPVILQQGSSLLPPPPSQHPTAYLHQTSPPLSSTPDDPSLPTPHNSFASPPRSFVSGAKPQTAVPGSGIWALPEKYQWLLAPSRSNSRQSSSALDDDDDTAVVPLSHVHRGGGGAVVTSGSQQQYSSQQQHSVKAQNQFVPPPPLGTPRGGAAVASGSSSSTVAKVKAPPVYDDDDSDDDAAVGLPRLDNDSFLEAARSAGIDVMALLDAKKREKHRERKKKKKLESRESSKASDDVAAVAQLPEASGVVMQPTTISAQILAATHSPPLATSLPSRSSHHRADTSEYPQGPEVPRLPPPAFARRGRSPPQLGQQSIQHISKKHLDEQPPHNHRQHHQQHIERRDHASHIDHQQAKHQQQQPSAQIVPPAIAKFQQKLRDQTPPNLRTQR